MATDESTSGVQNLIDRLSHEGVAEGEKRAEQIIAEAHRKADGILDDARTSAKEILEQAREEAEHFRTGGEEAYPAYLDSSIKSVYERAGVVTTRDGGEGSFTMIGTVSPAGGNFEEPVTQATLSTVKCFLGLSYDRAYRRFYPAIDPLISWSRYLDQLKDYFDRDFGPDWVDQVKTTQQLLHDGDRIHQMMQVTGEEGVTLEDFVTHQKSLFVDMVYLQQDGFDAVDSSVPIKRQQEAFALLRRLIGREYHFTNKEQVRDYFTRLTGLVKNLNYAPTDSDDYRRLAGDIEQLERSVP